MTTLAELQQLQSVNPVAAARLAQQILAEEATEETGNPYWPHEPLPKQQAFLDLDCLEALYGGAAGGGKTDALLMAALQYVAEPGYSAICFRRTFTELMLPDAIMDRSHQWLKHTAAHWSGLDKRWSFPVDSGEPATLSFGYLDGPQDHTRYQSAAFQFTGFDEVTHYRERQYRYLFSRLRKLEGSTVPLRMRGATNPGGVGHDWCKKRFAIPDTVDFSRIYNFQGRVFIPASLKDNPHLDRESYALALAELDATQRAQLESGQWVRDTEGLVYREYGAHCLVPCLPDLIPGEQWKRILCADFGVTNHTAFAALAFNRYVREVYVQESEQWTGLSPGEAAEIAISWGERMNGFEQIVGDIGGLGKAFQAEWQARFKLPMTPAEKTSKLGFIKLINGDLRESKLRIVDGPNSDLVECLGSLTWADDRAVAENPDQPNHLTDALLYGWRASRHFAAKDAPNVPAYGSGEWLKRETDKERAQAFAKNSKRVNKAARSLTERQLIAKIARM
jgi:hypothetical protein